jgi:hypothetical protein
MASIFNQLDVEELTRLRGLGVSSITLDAEGTVTKVEFFQQLGPLEFDLPEDGATERPSSVDPDSLPDGPYRRILKNGSVS